MVHVRRTGPADVDAWARLRVALMESEGLLNRGLTPEELAATIAE